MKQLELFPDQLEIDCDKIMCPECFVIDDVDGFDLCCPDPPGTRPVFDDPDEDMADCEIWICHACHCMFSRDELLTPTIIEW